MDPRLGARPVRIDATRTAYAVYSGAEQPPLGAHSVCFVPPRTQAHAVTRDSRNRARRKRKVRVDLYPSIVLLAWSLARSDEIDLSAIAVKREILQFVIAYCSLDL